MGNASSGVSKTKRAPRMEAAIQPAPGICGAVQIEEHLGMVCYGPVHIPSLLG